MGSIALPALSIKPPQQQPDVLSQYGNLLQLRNAMQEQPVRQQILAQQQQSGQLQLQQQQQQLNDQKIVTASLQNWNGKDINDLIPLIIKNGGSGQAVMGIRKNILDQQLSTATAYKDNAQGAEANVKATSAKNDLITGALSPLIDAKQVPDAQLAPALQSTVGSLVQQGVLDPQHAQAATQLLQSGDPATIRQGIDSFRKTLMAQSQISEEALKKAQTSQANANAANARGKIDPTSPLYAPSESSIALGTAPGAVQIQANQVQQTAKKAAAEENARMPGEMALDKQRQVLSQGDPNAAAQLLISGDATLSELKSRGATPDFIQNTLSAAHRLSGGKYNAQSADAQFQVAKSPANVAFFGSANSLTDKGGTLDQLQTAAKDIPGGLIPAFNSIQDWEKAATGSGPIAKYASIALGVADDYSKVMGGGQGSDTSRLQALKLVGASQSPDQRAASISGIRGAVGSQLNSRIGNNPVLRRMYGSDAAAPSSGMVTVQIPGSAPGQIPAAALQKFRADHPNAVVQQ